MKTTQGYVSIPQAHYRSECPYCGHVNAVTCQPYVYGHLIVCCLEEGGCDQPYMIKVQIEVEVESYAIEGCEVTR